MDSKRYLIVNADDFGQSFGVNRGIITAHERGILTSASLMVRWQAAAEAAGYARTHAKLSVGIHLDFGESAFRDGDWVRLYQVVAEEDPDAVEAEIAHQITAFQDLMACSPTHIDSHQHAHRHDPARSVVLRIAGELGIPVRDCTPEIQYTGRFYGQDDQGVSYPQCVSVDGLIQILRDLTPGVTELGCHPAEGEDLNTMYSAERQWEVSTLCDPRVRHALSSLQIELRSFADFGTAPTSKVS